MMRTVVCSLLLLAGCAEPSVADPVASATGSFDETSGTRTVQVETGDVRWLRDPDQAKLQAARAEKPVLMLFQEIPG